MAQLTGQDGKDGAATMAQQTGQEGKDGVATMALQAGPARGTGTQRWQGGRRRTAPSARTAPGARKATVSQEVGAARAVPGDETPRHGAASGYRSSGRRGRGLGMPPIVGVRCPGETVGVRSSRRASAPLINRATRNPAPGLPWLGVAALALGSAGVSAVAHDGEAFWL
jgi:hypothetical protein